jgi:CubicO group peptidase (beta-lactamase class C family)
MIHLTDRGWVDINMPLKQYVPKSIGTNKENMVLADIMAHVAGLKPWIPFYKFTLSDSKKYPRPLKKYYQPEKKSPFDIPVAEKFFMHTQLLDTIDNRIYDSELRSSQNYRYSDLGFYMLDDLINEVSGITLPEYVSQNFYQGLGLRKMGFNPWIWYNIHNIPPTEEDNYFRRKRIQGYVHDMGAAMRGGISGHAGLFSNSYEVAIIMQMLLNEGSYGGKRFIKPSTLESFTTRHYRSTRRGLGFDMKQLDSTKTPNMALSASDSTFGHLGFTGISTWADPEHNLIYIFISNRTYPNMKNNALNANNYRSDLQEIVYRSLKENQNP